MLKIKTLKISSFDNTITKSNNSLIFLLFGPTFTPRLPIFIYLSFCCFDSLIFSFFIFITINRIIYTHFHLIFFIFLWIFCIWWVICCLLFFFHIFITAVITFSLVLNIFLKIWIQIWAKNIKRIFCCWKY